MEAPLHFLHEGVDYGASLFIFLDGLEDVSALHFPEGGVDDGGTGLHICDEGVEDGGCGPHRPPPRPR